MMTLFFKCNMRKMRKLKRKVCKKKAYKCKMRNRAINLKSRRLMKILTPNRTNRRKIKM